MMNQQKITPFLWFNDQAEEAIGFYTSIFEDSSIKNIVRTGEDGKMMSGEFYLNGQKFIALNGGPQFSFTEAVSFFIHCDTQQEVDYYWEKLVDGGSPGQCGWLKDPFGLSWQVVPVALGKMLADKDGGKAQRVVQAMMGMSKLDVAKLEEAYHQPADI